MRNMEMIGIAIILNKDFALIYNDITIFVYKL